MKNILFILFALSVALGAKAISTNDLYSIWSTAATVAPNYPSGMVVSGTITVNGGAFISPQIISSNFVDGGTFSNSYSAPVGLSGTIKQTTAAVAGTSSYQIRDDASYANGGATNMSSISTTLAITLAQTYTNNFSIMCPTNSTVTFTNLSTGIGNSAALVTGSGQIVVY